MAGYYLSVAVWFSAACLLKESSAAITPSDETYNVTAGDSIFIPWTYDNAASMTQIFWAYKSSAAAATATTIMSKIGAANAQVFNNFNVMHVDTNGENGKIQLQTVTMDKNQGVYYCQVSYNLLSGLGTVTATATLSVTDSCKCECDCVCRTIVIVSMVFGILGALGLLIIVGGLLAGCFKERETLLLTSGVIVIVFVVLSLVLSIVVKVKECCECCKENCECCEEDSECCKDWIDNATIAFIVIPCVAVVASVVIFILVKLDIIGPGRNGGNGFFCFNNGNDDGNDSGNNGHHRGRGTNSSTVHTERTDTHRGTLSDRANSDGEVSRKDVHVQENRDNFSGRPMPPIPPLTDKKGRGLSANYDDDHPMTSVGIPDKKAGQLVPLKEQEEQKKKEESKKRRKRKKKAVSDDDDDDDDQQK